MSTAFLPFTPDSTPRKEILMKLSKSCKGVPDEHILDVFLLICSTSVSSVRALMTKTPEGTFQARLATVLAQHSKYPISTRTSLRLRKLVDILRLYGGKDETFTVGHLWNLCADSLFVPAYDIEYPNLGKIISGDLGLEDLHTKKIFNDSGKAIVFSAKSELEMYAFYCEYLAKKKPDPIKAVLVES